MAKPQHRTPAYAAACQRWTLIINSRGATCHATLCLHGDRTIPRGAPRSSWDLGHDPTGQHITGPWHMRCNRHEGAVRGNRMRARRRRYIPPPTPRMAVNDW